MQESGGAAEHCVCRQRTLLPLRLCRGFSRLPKSRLRSAVLGLLSLLLLGFANAQLRLQMAQPCLGKDS